MRKHIPTVLIILVFLTGVSLLLYPSISNYINERHQSRAITEYTKNVAKMDTKELEKMWKQAVSYNKKLASHGTDWQLSDREIQRYNETLNVNENGMMGYIEIPKLQSKLAIYHGVDEGILQNNIGHLSGSSLPVGGESTHCVLSGHRGLPSAKLFSELDQLSEGDQFMLYVLGRTLTYEVDQILIVLPDEMDTLQIEPGKDLCTVFFIKVSARELIDVKQKGSFTIKYPCSDAKFQIYKIADVSQYGKYTVTSDFAKYSIDLKIEEQTEWQTLASTLRGYVARDGKNPLQIKKTNADGTAYFGDLTVGLYLLIGDDAKDSAYKYKTEEAIIALPNLEEEDQWIFDITILPKYEREPWSPDGKVTSTGTDQKENTENKTESESDSEGKDKKLPQTGQLWWPVGMLAVSGIFLFLMGWSRRMSDCEEK